ncbi:hypothetical protein B0H10DRAFT_1766009, partial [Mycena sp. CBHHK59/15]
PEVDPESLCPYCDRPLPEKPSLGLLLLLEKTFGKSYSDAREGNTLGRKGPVLAFAGLCQRHMFESEEMPQALVNGWPASIDW